MRKSAPGPLPSSVRVVDGVHHIGRDPWAVCGLCSTHWAPAEFLSCPVCDYRGRQAHHDHLVALAFTALDSNAHN